MYRIISYFRIFQGQLKTLWRAFWHPKTPFYLKALMLGLVAYILLPIDIIPDFLRFFGLIDDVLIVALALNWIINRLPKEIYQSKSDYSDFDDDSMTIDGTSRRL